MSSYGSLSPATPPYYCAPPLQECNDFWTGELQRADVYSNQHSHYNHRGYDHQTGFLLDRCYGPPYGEGGLDRDGGQPPAPPDSAPFPRVVKRRSTANKKERRRTQSINTAFSDLRDCIPNVPADTKLSKNINTAFSELRERIPNVPADTKLSKIKTLRLATSYIAYLLGVLETDAAPAGGFRAELPSAPARRRSDAQGGNQVEQRRARGRTGWPQHVWALELKQEQNI